MATMWLEEPIHAVTCKGNVANSNWLFEWLTGPLRELLITSVIYKDQNINLLCRWKNVSFIILRSL